MFLVDGTAVRQLSFEPNWSQMLFALKYSTFYSSLEERPITERDTTYML